MWRNCCRRRHLREDGGAMADGQQRSPKRRKKLESAPLSENSSAAGAASGGEEPGPTGRTGVESCGKRRVELVHFDGHPAFTLEDLTAASTVVLGEGTYGTVRRATLENGKQVAVRGLSWADITSRHFEAEVNILGKIRHPNLLALRACYFSPEGEENLLVFDYMPKGSLSDFLRGRLRFIICDDYTYGGFSKAATQGPDNRIDWPTRKNIAVGITRGLHYLHTQRNMVHGNLTSWNVLLDDHTNAKIADYGLSLVMTPAAHSIVTAAAGALGYSAPELSKLKKPNSKTDVYSLGMIILALLTGKSPTKAINGQHLREWVAGVLKKQWKAFDKDLRMDAAEMTGNELLDTLTLALRCADPSPDARPEVWQVLQQLEGIKPKFAGGRDTTTAKGGDRSTDGCAHAAGTMATAVPTTGTDISRPSRWDMSKEMKACPLEDTRAGTSKTCNVLAIDGRRRPGQELLRPQINACNDEDEEHAKLTSKGDLEDGVQIPISTPAKEIIQDHSGNEDSLVNLSIAQPEGNINGASFPIFSMHEAMVEGKTEEGMSAEGSTDATAGDTTMAGQPSSINWAEIPIEAQLEVPTSPPLISSDPDSGYQRYFQTLYDLAHRSPPLPSDVLEVQLNRMIMGLHSLGYPLDTWPKAAALVLCSAKKREHRDQIVDEYFEVHEETLGTQLAELTSAVVPIEEEISRAQSDVTTLEQEGKELDETIAELEEQLLVLKTNREGVVDSLVTSRGQLAAAVAKIKSVLVDVECLNQQKSEILGLRRAQLAERPSLDEAFDSSFREILTKKF